MSQDVMIQRIPEGGEGESAFRFLRFLVQEGERVAPVVYTDPFMSAFQEPIAQNQVRTVFIGEDNDIHIEDIPIEFNVRIIVNNRIPLMVLYPQTIDTIPDPKMFAPLLWGTQKYTKRQRMVRCIGVMGASSQTLAVVTNETPVYDWDALIDHLRAHQEVVDEAREVEKETGEPIAHQKRIDAANALNIVFLHSNNARVFRQNPILEQ